MPIRTASLNNQIRKNGARLHAAMAERIKFEGEDHPASEHEQALLEERRFLKEAKAKRTAMAAEPRPKAPKFVHKEAGPAKEKAPKAAKEPKEAKAKPKAKDHLTRTEKHAKKAESLEAAKKAAKKSAKT
jgi:hypothetical protein